MITFFPKQISERAIIVYLVSLLTVSIVYMSYAMGFGYMALGCFWVVGFFSLSVYCSKRWLEISEKQYIKSIFGWALAIRIVWVIASYFFYMEVNGNPFEFDAGDSMGYHLDAEWLASEPWSSTWSYLFGNINYSDSGFPFYLTILYKLFGTNIVIPRLFNALLSSWACVLVYRLASRTFGDEVGRMAGVMMVFMPNLIIYCGYHLKETLMVFLEVACMERIDTLIRNRRFSFSDLILPILLTLVLFLFRTVLGAAAVFAFASAVLLSSAPSMKRNGKRVALIAWGVLALVVFGGGAIATEVEGYWEDREENVENKRLQQTIRGNRWAQYATGTVMAPMITVLPFATMVDVDGQYGQQAKSGGNYIRNFMGFFAILAIFEALRRKTWKNFVLIGAYTVAYLGIIATSGYSNSERFLLPGLPCLIMMWAYGISTLRSKTYKLLTPWCVIVFAMECAWAYFKLGSRGLF
ncbi:MAG: glycosyltransferase family 39 protein [Bacteroidales bacterium]|nr:glycosyltransferase family 39 protein [Bacteroidales bacterium]